LKKASDQKQTIKFLINILLGGAISLPICFLLLFFFSIGISAGWLEIHLTRPLTAIGCILGAGIGAMIACRRCGSRTLLVGLGTAAFFFLLLVAGGAFFYPSISIGQGGVIWLCSSLAAGGGVGLLCGKPKKKKRK